MAEAVSSVRSIPLEWEAWDQAVELDDGFWIIATRHRPAFSRMNPEVNNRCLVFQSRDVSGKQVLTVVNGVDPKVIPEVRRIERETKAEVRYIVSPGGGHHLQLPAWRDEFTTATVLVGPERIPHVACAKTLMDGPRVQVMDPDDPLPHLRGIVDSVLFTGLHGFAELKTPFEGGKDGPLAMVKMMKELLSVKTPVDELWLRHVTTATVIGGENLGWILSRKTLQQFPLLFRLMFKAESVIVNDKARKVADAQKVARAWHRVLKWPAQVLMGYHEPPGEAFFGDGRAALAAAVKAARQLI